MALSLEKTDPMFKAQYETAYNMYRNSRWNTNEPDQETIEEAIGLAEHLLKQPTTTPHLRARTQMLMAMMTDDWDAAEKHRLQALNNRRILRAAYHQGYTLDDAAIKQSLDDMLKSREELERVQREERPASPSDVPVPLG